MSETPEPTRFVLIGHVDHGKSTLAGHLLYKVGKFTQRDAEKASQDADKLKMIRWKWAYLLDTYQEERERGKTHEYCIEPFQWEGISYELIDTPGHSSICQVYY